MDALHTCNPSRRRSTVRLLYCTALYTPMRSASYGESNSMPLTQHSLQYTSPGLKRAIHRLLSLGVVVFNSGQHETLGCCGGHHVQYLQRTLRCSPDALRSVVYPWPLTLIISFNACYRSLCRVPSHRLRIEQKRESSFDGTRFCLSSSVMPSRCPWTNL